MRRIPLEKTMHARALRNEPTKAERILWRELSTLRPRFTRQLVIGPYIADFACRSVKLAIELDGWSHDASVAYDQRRTGYLEALGWQILRFGNQQALEDAASVAMACHAAAEARHPPPAPP